MTRSPDIPALAIGVGLRSSHYEHILGERPDVAWFEVLSDNYLHTRGRPLSYLDRIAARYPVALHGVGLSIGGTDALNPDYLRQLRALRERCHARWISDHIAWTGVGGSHGHELYPIPFTEECLRHMARRVCQVQDFLGERLILENPSTYLRFAGASLTEPEFVSLLVEESGCGLLLDLNNVVVNSYNHGFDARSYLKRLPLDSVVQLHVAGHDVVESGASGNSRPYRLDTHRGGVSREVWRLLEDAVRLGVRAPILLEWDADVPSFTEVHAEALKARPWVERGLGFELASGRAARASSARHTPGALEASP